MLLPDISLNTEQIILSRSLLYKFWTDFCPVRDIRDSSIAKKLLLKRQFNFDEQSDYIREVYTSAVIDYYYYIKYNNKMPEKFKEPLELCYPDPNYPRRILNHNLNRNDCLFMNNRHQLIHDIKIIGLKYCGLDQYSPLRKEV